MRLLAIGVVALAVGLAVGCGDDDEAEPAATETDSAEPTAEEAAAVFETDPCALLTAADVEAIIGTAAEGELGVEGDPASQTPAQCRWQPAGGVDITDPDSVQGIVVAAGGELWYSGSVGLAEEDQSYDELDLGDQSFAGDTGGGFMVGPQAITVQLSTGAVPESHPKVIDALERVFANLPDA